jgi:hypothetical protein
MSDMKQELNWRPTDSKCQCTKSSRDLCTRPKGCELNVLLNFLIFLSVRLLLQMYRKDGNEIICIILCTYTHSFSFLSSELNVACMQTQFCPHKWKLEEDCLSVIIGLTVVWLLAYFLLFIENEVLKYHKILCPILAKWLAFLKNNEILVLCILLGG